MDYKYLMKYCERYPNSYCGMEYSDFMKLLMTGQLFKNIAHLYNEQRDSVPAVSGMIIFNKSTQRYNICENGVWLETYYIYEKKLKESFPSFPLLDGMLWGDNDTIYIVRDGKWEVLGSQPEEQKEKEIKIVIRDEPDGIDYEFYRKLIHYMLIKHRDIESMRERETQRFAKKLEEIEKEEREKLKDFFELKPIF